MERCILYGTSALECLRTAPTLRELAFSPRHAAALRRAAPKLVRRAGSSPEARILEREMLGPLKGVSFPVHVLSETGNRNVTPQLVRHVRREDLDEADLLQVADGLFVTTPRLTLMHLARTNSLAAVTLAMMECCGLYATPTNTSRLQQAADLLEDAGRLGSGSKRYAAFLDWQGRELWTPDPLGGGSSWEPCYTPEGKRTSLWKRPPLCSAGELRHYARTLSGPHGAKRFRQAARIAMSGAGSPLEAQAALLAGGPRRLGCEGLPAFALNRRIRLAEHADEADAAAGVADLCWTDRATGEPVLDCEVNGGLFHTASRARDAVRVASSDAKRKAALEHRGIAVEVLTFAQMIDVGQWDLFVDLLARRLGVRRPTATATFVQRRARFRQDLLLRPGV